MNKHPILSRSIAAFLAVCLAFSLMLAAPAAALAEGADSSAAGSLAAGNDTAAAPDGSSGSSESVESITSPAAVPAENEDYVIDWTADEPGLIKQSFPGIEDSPVGGAHIGSENGAQAYVDIQGDISATDKGLLVTSKEESFVVAFSDGSVTSGYDAVTVSSSDHSYAAVITGDITAIGEQSYGAVVTTSPDNDGSGAESSSDGSGTEVPQTEAAAGSDADAPQAESASGSSAPETGSTSFRAVGEGFVEVPEVPFTFDEINQPPADGAPDFVAQVNADSVTAPGGIYVLADSGTAAMQVGEITATGTAGEDFQPNTISAYFGAAIVAVEGDIDSADNGLNLIAEGALVDVNQADDGTIRAKGIGLNIDNETGAVYADVGSIESTGDGIVSKTGDSQSGTVVIADGSVKSSEGNAITIDSTEGGQVMAAVAEDAVSEKKAGLSFAGSGKEGEQSQVLVVGTLKGVDGIELTGSAEQSSALDLTVWKIEADGGSLVKGEGAEEVSKKISYIVMIEQPEAGASLRATKADDSNLDKKYDNEGQGGFEVAVEGQKVLLKIENLESGYVLKGAYNGKEEKVELKIDEKGNYYFEVPEGGGILLQAILEKLQKSGAAPSKASSALITLDPAGGTIAGKTEFRKALGKTFVFTEEPVWEGHTFLYWQSTAHPELSYHTGDKFIIQEPDTFVAVWG